MTILHSSFDFVTPLGREFHYYIKGTQGYRKEKVEGSEPEKVAKSVYGIAFRAAHKQYKAKEKVDGNNPK